MSTFLLCVCALMSVEKASSSVIHSHKHSSWEVDQIEEILAPEEIRELQYWEEKYFHRSKRSEDYGGGSSGSGSGDLVATIAKAITNGIKKKVKAVASGSAGAIAGASAGFSKGSSGGDGPKYHTTGYGEHPTGYDHVDAIKAIKGGVLAIKGQLIKGSGFIVSGAGKVIAASGDKVTGLGKNIISKAVLVKPNKYPEYGPPTAYGPPSAPPSSYGAPPPSYSGPSSYAASYTDHYPYNDAKFPLPPGSQAGILILKKIQSDNRQEEGPSRVPEFKPLSSASPSYGTIINKILSASVKPSQASNFGRSNSQTSHNSVQSYKKLNKNNYEIITQPIVAAPTASDYSLTSNQELSTTSNSILKSPSAPDASGFAEGLKPPPTTYGVPFEYKEPSFDDYLSVESSQKSLQSVKPEKLTKGEALDKFKGAEPINSNSIRNFEGPFSSEYLENYGAQEMKTSGSTNYLKSSLYPESSELFDMAHSNDFLRSQSFTSSEFKMPVSSVENLGSFLNSKNVELKSYFGSLKNISDEDIFKKITTKKSKDWSRPLSAAKTQKIISNDLSYRRPNPDFVRSISYELTPNGPKRLT